MLILGVLVDCYGCWLVLLLLLVGVVVDYFVMVLLLYVWVLYVGCVVVGIIGVNYVVVIVYVVDIIVLVDCVCCYGLMNVCFGLGFIVGLVLGGLLGDWWLCVLFLLVVVFNGVNFLVVCFVLLELCCVECVFFVWCVLLLV